MQETHSKEIRIMIVGSRANPWLAEAFYNSLSQMRECDTCFFDTDICEVRSGLFSVLKKFENKYCVGFDVTRINNRLVTEVEREKIDFLFLYGCRIISDQTVKKIKKLGVYIASYCNDDPFADYYPWYFWRNFIKTIPLCNIVYVYRKKNIEDCLKKGAKNVRELRSYYIKERNFYREDIDEKLYVPKVVFMGHYEKDERLDFIKALLDEGIEVGVPKRKEWIPISKSVPGLYLIDDSRGNYNSIINKAQIALVFLSKINNDTYTRRCFEIPATKTFMIAPYTEDIAGMYENGKEAVLFHNKEDFVQKINYYLEHDDDRQMIAEAGYERLMSSGD